MSTFFEAMLFSGLFLVMVSAGVMAASTILEFSYTGILSGAWFGWSAVQLWRMWHR